MEILEISKCQSCHEDFESQERIPLILPCKHNICFECGFNDYKRNREISCVQQQCGQIYKIHPSKLEQDSQLLKRIENQVISQIKSNLENQKFKVRKARVQLAEMRFKMIKQIIQHFTKFVLKDNINLQRHLKQIEQKLLKQIQMIERNQCDRQFLLQVRNNPQDEKEIQQLLKEQQIVIEQNNKIILNAYEYFEQIKNNDHLPKENLKQQKEHESKKHLIQNKDEEEEQVILDNQISQNIYQQNLQNYKQINQEEEYQNQEQDEQQMPRSNTPLQGEIGESQQETNEE